MAVLGRDILNGRAGFKRLKVAVPELGGAVLIRELSAAEVLRIAEIQAENPPDAVRRILATVLVAGWIDEDGANVFVSADADALLALPAAAATRIANAITDLSGTGPVAAADRLAEAKNA